ERVGGPTVLLSSDFPTFRLSDFPTFRPVVRSRPLAPGLPSVSLIGFGGMPLSIAGRPDAETAEAVLHASFDAGVTLIDTADAYCLDERELGHNERLIAGALRTWGGPRERLLVASKGG